MTDPSAHVSSQLLYHLHALCSVKYPPYQTLQPEPLVDLLLKAPHVSQQYPFTWALIDTPPPGTLMLAWSSPQMGNACPSDGYIWADVESVYSIDVKGYTVEIFHHKAGFNPNPQSGHTHALYSRRRYRLKPHSPNTPALNANIWLLHYIPADRQHQIPINAIQLSQATRQALSHRNYLSQLFQTGQLPRKDFFLNDQGTWPMMAVPNQQLQQHIQQISMQQQQQHPGSLPQTPQNSSRHISPINARSTPQPQQSSGGYYTPGVSRPSSGPSVSATPSAKRLKPTPPASQHPSAAAAAQAAALGVGDPSLSIDEEEDTSRGDIFDHLSPREIATTRYVQHHEWMEEIFGSAYSTNQIKPVDLGLGLRGELEGVTNGLIPPPIPHPGEVWLEYDPKKMLEQFRPRVDQKLEKMEKEMKMMEEAHAKRLERIQTGEVFRKAEIMLRGDLAVFNPVTGEFEEPVVPDTPQKTADEISVEVEKLTGKRVMNKFDVVKWELTDDQIIAIGGVVADGHNDGNGGNMDTMMSDSLHTNGNSLADDAFKLSTPGTPNIGSSATPQQQSMSMGEEFHSIMMEDSIMDDFMNIDSKPETPHHLHHNHHNHNQHHQQHHHHHESKEGLPIGTRTPELNRVGTPQIGDGQNNQAGDGFTPGTDGSEGLTGNPGGIPGLNLLGGDGQK